MRKSIWVAAVILSAFGPLTSADARKTPREVWSVSRSTDPITGDSSCVVTAFDRAAGMSFSRMGYLYPIVESNSKLGLLVGVSSGGRIRLPTGDILWRVDDRPHRELKAADNPMTGGAAFGTAYKTGNEAADKAMAAAMAQTSGLAASMTATSTVASGDRAKEMLAEMVAGGSLVFRQAAAVPTFGLPTGRASEIGQVTKDGLRPIPLDASFRRGLAECGIVAPGA
jgi:hypothetical protein